MLDNRGMPNPHRLAELQARQVLDVIEQLGSSPGEKAMMASEVAKAMVEYVREQVEREFPT